MGNLWFYMAFSTAILWGVYYACNEQIQKHIDLKTYLCISFLVNLTGYAIWALSSGVLQDDLSSPRIYKAMPWIIICCMASFIGNYCSVAAVKYGGAAYASIIEISYPVWVVIFVSIINGKNEITLKTMIGGIIIFLGTLLVIKTENVTH